MVKRDRSPIRDVSLARQILRLALCNWSWGFDNKRVVRNLWRVSATSPDLGSNSQLPPGLFFFFLLIDPLLPEIQHFKKENKHLKNKQRVLSLISPRLPSKLTLPADLSFPSVMASFSPIHCSLLSSCILFHILYQYATLTLLKCYSFHRACIHIAAPKPTQTQLGVPQHCSSVSGSGPCLPAGCSVPRVSTRHVAFSAS